MKKSIIALILAVSMLLTCSLTAMAASGNVGEGADNTVTQMGDLTLTGDRTDRTGDVPLKSGESYTITFHNQSNGTLNWNNYILTVAGDPSAQYELGVSDILAIRPDNWGWGGGMSDIMPPNGTGNILSFSSDINFDEWVSACQTGLDVSISLARNGDTFAYSATIGSWHSSTTVTSGTPLGETVYVFMSGDTCVLTGITFTKTSSAPTDPELPDGAVVIEGYNSVDAGTVALKDGASATFSFHNQSTGDQNWHNFVFKLTGDGEDLGYIRADNFGDSAFFGGGFNGVTNGFEADWAAWLAEAKVGFDVTATISRTGNTLICDVKMGEGGKYTETFTLTSSTDLPKNITVKLTGEKCILSNISYSATAGENSGVGSETVPLRDEGKYTFEFNTETPEGVEKSDFSLNVTDGDGNTVLIIKEDGTFTNGEGYTFTEVPAAAATAMALSTGTDVKIEISRAGNDLTYTITKGEAAPITKTLTADKDLPTTVNVQLTATNCTLNNVDVQGDVGKEPEVGQITYTDADFTELVVTDFFVAKSDAYALKDGQGYTFKFKNKSYGTNNYENFVLGITEDINKIDPSKEILIIRADNWFWGGEGSYFSKDGWQGTSNINWDTFVSEAQAGFDVELSIGRSGNTLIYKATIGSYTVEYNAVSPKDYPEEIYVFLTGQNCTLYTGTEPARPAPTPTPEPTPTPSTPDDPVDGVAEVESIEGSLTANNFFNRKTGAVALKSGESLKLTFNNMSFGVENWHNYVLAVVGAVGTPYPGQEKEVLVIRADAYAWGGGLATFGALTFDTNVTDWEAFKADAKAGMATEVLIERVGDTLHFLAKMGDKYTSELTATSSVALPETLYVFLTGEQVTLSNIASVKGEAGDLKPVEPDTPATADKIEGDLTVDAFLSAKTDSIPLWDGGSYTFKFNAKSNGVENWDNFVIGLVDDKGGEVILIRADNYAWGGTGSYYDAMNGETNITDWEAFKAAAKAGFDVEVTIKREGDKLTYTAKMGDYTVTLTPTAKKPLPETLYLYISGEKCKLTGITTEGAPGKMPEGYKPGESTETKPQQTYTPKIEGDLTVTGFFLEKTNMVPLSSGDSYTFTFTNTSKGSNNWENFVIGIVGATGAAYTGAKQEILIIRADNWGWGGGMSDFVKPDEAAGNKLAFESNIDWDKWVAACKAGVPVTVTISRNGNTLNYEATIGDWYVKLSATSGKALPKTAYLFLTGENCTLSNIKTISAPTYSSPATGETGTAVWVAVLAILASLSTAIVVLKRPRKSEQK